MAQRIMNQTSIHEDLGLTPGLAQWITLCELWWRSQTQLGSHIAVAVVAVAVAAGWQL